MIGLNPLGINDATVYLIDDLAVSNLYIRSSAAGKCQTDIPAATFRIVGGSH